MAQARRGLFAVPRSRADLGDDGAADGGSWWRTGGCVVFSRRCVAARRNGPDVPADERLPFGALAEADLQPAKPSLPVLIRVRSKKISRRVSPFALPNRLKPRRAETEIYDGSFALSLGHCRSRRPVGLRCHRRHGLPAGSAAADHTRYLL